MQGSISFQRSTQVDGLLPTQAPITQTGTSQRVLAPTAAYTGVLSNNTVVEARYAGFYVDNRCCAANPPGGSQTATRFINRDTGFESGAIHGWYEYHANRTTVTGKLSHHATEFLGSGHDFKLGLQYNDAPMNGLYSINDFVLSYSVNGVPHGYGYQYSPYRYGGTATTIGGFVDDAVEIGSRLTLNLGVRYDHTHTRAFPEAQLDKNAQPTSLTFPGIDYYTWNTVSPGLDST